MRIVTMAEKREKDLCRDAAIRQSRLVERRVDRLTMLVSREEGEQRRREKAVGRSGMEGQSKWQRRLRGPHPFDPFHQSLLARFGTIGSNWGKALIRNIGKIKGK